MATTKEENQKEKEESNLSPPLPHCSYKTFRGEGTFALSWKTPPFITGAMVASYGCTTLLNPQINHHVFSTCVVVTFGKYCISVKCEHMRLVNGPVSSAQISHLNAFDFTMFTPKLDEPDIVQVSQVSINGINETN